LLFLLGASRPRIGTFIQVRINQAAVLRFHGPVELILGVVLSSRRSLKESLPRWA